MSTGSLEAAREALARLVLDIPDHPEPGVVFKDITPVLSDPAGLAAVVAGLTTAGLDESGSSRVDAVVGMEARGFILAPPVALALGAGFVPVRKAGKLPRETHAVSYDLEYGSATLELHRDAVRPGDRVLLVDDVLATGGIIAATVELLRSRGADVVAAAVVLEISALGGRSRCAGYPLACLRLV